MRKADDKGMHKGLMALAIGGPSGSEAGMMVMLELVDIGEGRVNEPAQRIAFRDHPLPNPSVTSRGGSRRFLKSASEDLRGDRQASLEP